MLNIIDSLFNSLFLFALKILGALFVACAAYISVQIVFKILANTITKM